MNRPTPLTDRLDNLQDNDTLQVLANAIREISVSKGWEATSRTEGDWAMLAVSEIAEAFEEVRKDSEFVYAGEKGKPEGIAVEYADAMIRILHWFAYHDIPVMETILLKVRYNMTREHRHGGKKL